MNLKYVRDEFDLKQKEVAEILGVATSTYSIWETNTNIIPLNRLIKFCTYFNVSLDFVLGLTKTMHYDNMRNNIDYNLHRKRIKLLRKHSNYTQKYIANLLKTDPGVISRYEGGKTLILTAFLIDYAKLFNVSSDYIMGRIDKAISIEEEIKI